MPVDGPDVVLYEKRGHVGIITMNRPERLNALGGGLPQRVRHFWDEINKDDEVWVGILTGVGRSFCAGADLRAAADRDAAAESGEATGESSFLVPSSVNPHSPVPSWKPTIAALNGFALGGGFHMAMTCDIRIAADTAEIGMPEVRWNRSAGFGARLEYFPTISIACEMLLWGERISAQRAYEIGFVNKVVPADKLMETAMEYADTVTDKAPASVRNHKMMIYNGRDMGIGALEAYGRALFGPIGRMEDSKEGARAFVEKRKPQWKLR
ncbi:MAG: enoyl-CoA hydratase [Dehalococcoidia bacterium]|nr:enoyl-CoA hydratase [Dehalococcoidia bacterium]